MLLLVVDALKRIGLFAEVDSGCGAKTCDDPIHQLIVPVITAQVGVAIGGLHLKDPIGDLENRDIEVLPPKS